MIPQKVKDHLDEYISQEIYVQVAIIKGKEKVSTQEAINKYFNTNHFKDLALGRPFEYFIEDLRDKCLGKLKNSPMRNKKTEDQTILQLQQKLNQLNDHQLDNTYWEIETGEFFSEEQIKELENERNTMKSKLKLENDNKLVLQTILNFCKKYEELCQQKYPEAPLPLELLKSIN